MKIGLTGMTAAFENFSGEKKLVFGNIKKENILQYQIHMLTENKIPGLPDFNIRDVDSGTEFIFSIENIISIEDYFHSHTVTIQEFISVFIKILQVISHAQMYLLSEQGFLLDSHFMFLNPNSKNIKLVYLPVDHEAEFHSELLAFVLQLLLQSSRQDPTDPTVARIISLFRKKGNNINALIAGLKSIENEKTNYDCQVEQSENDAFRNDDFREKNRQLLQLTAKFKSPSKNATQEPRKSLVYWILFGCFITLVLILFSFFADKKVLLNPIVLLERQQMIGIGFFVGSIIAVYLLLQYKRQSSKKEIPPKDIGYNSVKDYSEVNLVATALDSSLDETTILGDSLTSSSVMKDGKVPVLKSLSGRETIILSKSEFVIGRNKERCDYQMNNGSIGRTHLRFSMMDGKYYITDLASKNGTFINGERLESDKNYELHESDIVKIAAFEFTFLIQNLFPEFSLER